MELTSVPVNDEVRCVLDFEGNTTLLDIDSVDAFFELDSAGNTAMDSLINGRLDGAGAALPIPSNRTKILHTKNSLHWKIEKGF